LNTTNKPLLRALSGAAVDPPPVWLMRQAGRYLPEYRKTRASAGSFLELCYTPALAAEVTLQPIRRFGFDAAILFSDILVVPDAMGQKVWFEEGAGPRLTPIMGSGDLKALGTARVRERLAPVYDTASRVAQALPLETVLIGFAGAPWTVAAYMVEGQGSRDFAAARHWAVTEPDSFARLIEMLVEATAEHLCAQIEAGAGAVQIFDSWAGSLSAADFERWSMRPTAEIVRRVKSRHPNARVIGFPRGCGARAAEYANATGVDAVSIDQATVAERARDELRVAVQGNLDPVLLMAGGAAMAREVTHLRSVFAGRPFIFNLGHGVLPATPPDHVAELVRLVRA
jgi:uroporphyrinogen decarboxylase